jgi:FdhE protein
MSNELGAQIDRITQKRPMYKDALSIYKDLVGFLMEIEPEITSEIKNGAIDEIKAREGFPVFSREDLPLDRKAAISLFPRLLEHLSSKKRKDREALKKARKKIKSNPQWVHHAMSNFLSRDEQAIADMAKEINLEPMVLKFLTHMALKPSLNIVKKVITEKITINTWNYGYCPLCGSSPDIAYLDTNGKRYLHCELCGYEWNYPRLKCPFCENDNPKELGYFVSEEEDGFRIDFCKKCNSYIKTVDMRIIDTLGSLELENLTTLHLDMLAYEQGFNS